MSASRRRRHPRLAQRCACTCVRGCVRIPVWSTFFVHSNSSVSKQQRFVACQGLHWLVITAATGLKMVLTSAFINRWYLSLTFLISLVFQASAFFIAFALFVQQSLRYLLAYLQRLTCHPRNAPGNSTR